MTITAFPTCGQRSSLRSSLDRHQSHHNDETSEPRPQADHSEVRSERQGYEQYPCGYRSSSTSRFHRIDMTTMGISVWRCGSLRRNSMDEHQTENSHWRRTATTLIFDNATFESIDNGNPRELRDQVQALARLTSQAKARRSTTDPLCEPLRLRYGDLPDIDIRKVTRPRVDASNASNPKSFVIRLPRLIHVPTGHRECHQM